MSFVYMIRCKDNTLYTGSTTNLKKRMAEHISQTGAGAKYTKAHPIEEIAMVWEIKAPEEEQANSRYSKDYKLALRYEYHIKRLSRQQKDALLLSPETLLPLLAELYDVQTEGVVTPCPELSLESLGLA